MAGAAAFAALGRLQLQATTAALSTVFGHFAPHLPDTTRHHLLEREADGVLNGGFFRIGGGTCGFSRRFTPGVADHLQCPIDALNLSQSMRAAVAIWVPACGQAAPRNLYLGIAGARCQAKFVVWVV